MDARIKRVRVSSEKFTEAISQMGATDLLRIKPLYNGQKSGEGIVLQIVRDNRVVQNVEDAHGFIPQERKIPCENAPLGYKIEQIEGVEFQPNSSSFFQASVQALAARQESGAVKISLTNGRIYLAGQATTTASADAILYHDQTSAYSRPATPGLSGAVVDSLALI